MRSSPYPHHVIGDLLHTHHRPRPVPPHLHRRRARRPAHVMKFLARFASRPPMPLRHRPPAEGRLGRGTWRAGGPRPMPPWNPSSPPAAGATVEARLASRPSPSSSLRNTPTGPPPHPPACPPTRPCGQSPAPDNTGPAHRETGPSAWRTAAVARGAADSLLAVGRLGFGRLGWLLPVEFAQGAADPDSGDSDAAHRRDCERVDGRAGVSL